MEWNEERKREVEAWLAHVKMRVPKRIEQYGSMEDFVAKTFSNGGDIAFQVKCLGSCGDWGEMPLDEPAFDQRMMKAQRANQLQNFTDPVQQIWQAAMQDPPNQEHVYREVFALFKRLEETAIVSLPTTPA